MECGNSPFTANRESERPQMTTKKLTATPEWYAWAILFTFGRMTPDEQKSLAEDVALVIRKAWAMDAIETQRVTISYENGGGWRAESHAAINTQDRLLDAVE